MKKLLMVLLLTVIIFSACKRDYVELPPFKETTDRPRGVKVGEVTGVIPMRGDFVAVTVKLEYDRKTDEWICIGKNSDKIGVGDYVRVGIFLMRYTTNTPVYHEVALVIEIVPPPPI